VAVDLSFQGTLFSSDFLTESITRLAEWKTLDDVAIDAMAADLRDLFGRFPTEQKPNEARTENELIWPILKTLGFEHTLQQVNLTVKGRDDIPDGLLFADTDTKSRADSFPEEWKRYEFGLAIVEAKRWNRPLDRRAERKGEELAPSTQMLRYLRRVDDITSGKLRWGILTNGGRWRLYWSGARSVSEQFFDIDLAAVLGIAGQGDLLAPQNYAFLPLFSGARPFCRQLPMVAVFINAPSMRAVSMKNASPMTFPIWSSTNSIPCWRDLLLMPNPLPIWRRCARPH
jgi:hypothetical protein